MHEILAKTRFDKKYIFRLKDQAGIRPDIDYSLDIQV